MLRKSPAKIISIDCARQPDLPPEPPAQAVGTKRPFFGNQHSERRFFAMYGHWRNKVAQHYRIPPSRIDEQIVESIHERREAA